MKLTNCCSRNWIAKPLESVKALERVPGREERLEAARESMPLGRLAYPGRHHASVDRHGRQPR